MRFAISPAGITVRFLQRGSDLQEAETKSKPEFQAALGAERSKPLASSSEDWVRTTVLSGDTAEGKQQVAIQARDDITSPVMGLLGVRG